MNDTFANWRKKKKGRKDHHAVISIADVTDQEIVLIKPVADKNSCNTIRSGNFRGLTLDQHFKCKSSSESNTTEHSSTAFDSMIQENDDCDETKQYFEETFEIHETDEDDYN